MRKKTMFHAAVLTTVAIVSLWSAAGPVFAGTAGGGYHPTSTAEAPFIFYPEGAVSNSDTGTFHVVIAEDTVLVGGPATIKRTLFGLGNGEAFSCSLVARHLSSGNAYIGSSTSFDSTLFPLSLLVILPNSGSYALSTSCGIPRVVSGHGAYLFGTSP
jgi:hypothetical protein